MTAICQPATRSGGSISKETVGLAARSPAQYALVCAQNGVAADPDRCYR